MNRNMMIAIAAVVILLIGGFLLINRSNNSESVLDNDNDDQVAQQTTTPEASIGESTSSGDTTSADSTTGTVKEFTLSGSPFKFDPATLTVNKGDTVKITFKNLNGTHDFVIDELNIKTKTLQTGGQEVVEFTADEAGTFEYYCSVGNHRQMGMKGTLVVK